MKTKYKFIYFEAGYRDCWFCYSNKKKTALGLVEYYGRWKQWCYFPASETVYSHDCLADIRDFLNQLNRTVQGEKGKKEC